MFEYLSASGVVSAALLAPPGADVISALCQLDRLTLSEQAQLDLLVAWERQAAWVAACTQPLLVAAGDNAQAAAQAFQSGSDPSELPLRAAHAEIAAATRTSEVVAASRLTTAQVLVDELPRVQQALAAGEISFWHANAIVEATSGLTPEQARVVADRVLGRAVDQTVAQLRRSLRRAVVAADPEAAAGHARQARAERRLDWWPLPDGMAELRLIASANDIMSVYQAADALARRLQKDYPAPSQPGWQPVDTTRADALIQLVIGNPSSRAGERSAPASVQVQVNVTLDLATLLGLREHPGELAGYGPLPAPLARALAADGNWRRLVHDPKTGALLDLGHTAYKPSAALARYIRARDLLLPGLQPPGRALRPRPHPPLPAAHPRRWPHRP